MCCLKVLLILVVIRLVCILLAIIFPHLAKICHNISSPDQNSSPIPKLPPCFLDLLLVCLFLLALFAPKAYPWSSYHNENISNIDYGSFINVRLRTFECFQFLQSLLWKTQIHEPPKNKIVASIPTHTHLLPAELKGFFGVFLTSALWDCSCTVHKVFPARNNNQPICLRTGEYFLSPVLKLQFLFIFFLLVQIFHYCLNNKNCMSNPQLWYKFIA